MDAKYNDVRVKDLKMILEELPDDMLVVIPVVDEDNVNNLLGFRKVRTAGILVDDYEEPGERRALCLNGAADGYDIADQVHISGRDVCVNQVLYGHSEYGGPNWPKPLQ